MDLISADDARMWGREAFEMGLTLDQARSSIQDHGCTGRCLAEVDLGYNRARSASLHREG